MKKEEISYFVLFANKNSTPLSFLQLSKMAQNVVLAILLCGVLGTVEAKECDTDGPQR